MKKVVGFFKSYNFFAVYNLLSILRINPLTKTKTHSIIIVVRKDNLIRNMQ
jgi:hypothetical protein